MARRAARAPHARQVHANELREANSGGGVSTLRARDSMAALMGVLLLVFASVTSATVKAAVPASSASPATTNEANLPPLPAIPRLEPAPPERAETEDLDGRLQRLASESASERKEALIEVLEVRPKLLGAVLQRLDKLAARADRERMKRAMAAVREKGAKGAESPETAARGSGEPHADLLAQLIDRARPKDDGWRDLLELVAISRMLTQIGNVQAARGLIEIYVRFGEFMRVDVQNRLADLRDGAVAALIEARRHRAEKIAHWAERQLDRLGKGAPSEAIRTDDFEILGDVLRAYGRTKDADAARIIVSYASSERYQIREAARQAMVMLGEVGIWQVRDAYENVVGRRPRRDWSWDRTVRELLYEYDRLHAAKINALLDEGKKAESEGRWTDMGKAYDALLTRAPEFDQAPTLAPGYLRLAEKLARTDPAAAQAALVRVERLAADVTLRNRASSLRDTLRAEQLLQGGVIDTYRLRNAADRDPSNQRAKDLLSAGDRSRVEAQMLRTRWMTSGAIAVIAFGAILFVLLFRRERTRANDVTPPSTGGADAPPNATRPSVGSADAPPDGPSRTPLERDRRPLEPGSEVIQPPEPLLQEDDASLDAPPKRRDPFEDF